MCRWKCSRGKLVVLKWAYCAPLYTVRVWTEVDLSVTTCKQWCNESLGILSSRPRWSSATEMLVTDAREQTTDCFKESDVWIPRKIRWFMTGGTWRAASHAKMACQMTLHRFSHFVLFGVLSRGINLVNSLLPKNSLRRWLKKNKKKRTHIKRF